MGTRVGTGVAFLLLATAAFVAPGSGTAVRGAAPGGTPPNPVPGPKYQVKSIRGYLYYQERGTFDDADILTGKVALRNVFIGEGDALTPSGAVLILVDVEGPDFAKSIPPSAFLRVDARSGGRQAVSVRVRLGDLYSGSRHISVPVLVYGAFCSELRIKVHIEGVKGGDAVTATAPFTCGE